MNWCGVCGTSFSNFDNLIQHWIDGHRYEQRKQVTVSSRQASFNYGWLLLFVLILPLGLSIVGHGQNAQPSETVPPTQPDVCTWSYDQNGWTCEINLTFHDNYELRYDNLAMWNMTD